MNGIDSGYPRLEAFFRVPEPVRAGRGLGEGAAAFLGAGFRGAVFLAAGPALTGFAARFFAARAVGVGAGDATRPPRGRASRFWNAGQPLVFHTSSFVSPARRA